MISKDVAQQIVTQTMVRLNRNINIMDTRGIILGTGDKERLNKVHEGALWVTRTEKPLIISEGNMEDWPGCKEGINLPIFYKGEVVAVVGITGKPQDLKEVAELVQLTCEMMIFQYFVTSELEWNKKWKDQLFFDLETKSTITENTLNRMNYSKFSWQPPFMVVIVKFCREASHRSKQILEGFFENHNSIVGILPNGDIGLLFSKNNRPGICNTIKSLQTFDIIKEIQAIGIGKEVKDAKDIYKSFLSAQMAIKEDDTKKIIEFHDIIFPYLLHYIPTNEQDDFINYTLNHLDKKLIKTIEVLFNSSLSIQITAEKLGVHRHTLSYRINKIKQLTGLDATKFEEAVKLWLAITMKKIPE